MTTKASKATPARWNSSQLLKDPAVVTLARCFVLEAIAAELMAAADSADGQGEENGSFDKLVAVISVTNYTVEHEVGRQAGR